MNCQASGRSTVGVGVYFFGHSDVLTWFVVFFLSPWKRHSLERQTQDMEITQLREAENPATPLSTGKSLLCVLEQIAEFFSHKVQRLGELLRDDFGHQNDCDENRLFLLGRVLGLTNRSTSSV